MTAGSKIDYEALAQDALRGVVRTVLTEVARTGLPGDHHFYVSFDTRAPGVNLSKRLREKYPEEMTIVLQHRFWDLTVTEERFEVKLTFDGIPERLVIPFVAIRVFFDPSVRYGLQFEDPHYSGPDAGSDATEPSRPMVVAAGSDTGRTTRVTRTGERSTRQPKKTKPVKSDGPAAQPAPVGAGEGPAAPTTPVIAAVPKPAVPAPAASAGDEAKKPDGAQIVSLDAFRKK